MAEEITAKIKNCFEESGAAWEKEYVVKDQTGRQLCRFKLRALTSYEFMACQAGAQEDTNANILLKSLVSLENGNGEGRPINAELTGPAGLSRTRILEGKTELGMFDLILSKVLGLNILEEAEAKN